MGGHALNILESRVNDASLIGIHGIKHNISAILSDLCGALLSECAQGCLALLAVVADVERDSSRLVRASVDDKADEILDSVECLSPAADSRAVVAVIFDRDADFFVSLFDLYLCALNAKACKNFFKIFLRAGLGRSIIAHLDLCGSCSEQTEHLLCRHLENFNFKIRIGGYAELRDSVSFCKIDCCAGSDSFF
ncbi:unknown [Firmicutes bacterium CAG:240]|nr:unknown [Firmicutes bacterium CAG:240]